MWWTAVFIGLVSLPLLVAGGVWILAPAASARLLTKCPSALPLIRVLLVCAALLTVAAATAWFRLAGASGGAGVDALHMVTAWHAYSAGAMHTAATLVLGVYAARFGARHRGASLQREGVRLLLAACLSAGAAFGGAAAAGMTRLLMQFADK